MISHGRRRSENPPSMHSRYAHARGRHWRPLVLAVIPFGALLAAGCTTSWDELTSRDFRIKSVFVKEDPMVILRDSPDGDKRAKVLRALSEPKENGGNDEQQDLNMKILTAAATSDHQPLCRLAAIKTLSHYKDPRAADALVASYHQAASAKVESPTNSIAALNSSFTPETVTVIRCQALTALGLTKSQPGLNLLVLVLKEPPPEGTDAERQQSTDLRIAAAGALSNYDKPEASQALVSVLKTEKDIALRHRAVDSLQTITGKDLPPDAVAWDSYLQEHKDGPKESGLKILPVSWFGK